MNGFKLTNLNIYQLINRMSYSHAQLIDKQLFLGSIEAANDEKWLRDNNITHIVGLVDGQKRFSKISYLTYNNIGDSQNQNIVKYFGVCFSFIENAISRGGNVLVHCYAGISRSTTIVVGFMMYKYGTSLQATFDIVKSKRTIIFPNYGFILQLKVFNRLSHNDRIIWCKHNKVVPLQPDTSF